MIPVDQSMFGRPNGNCWPAVLASLLCIPLDEVPHFCRDHSETWWEDTVSWLAQRGFSPLELHADLPTWGDVQPNPGQLCWLIGGSPRGDWDHAIVGRWSDEEWTVAHDPHPDRTGLTSYDRVGFLISLVPVHHQVGDERREAEESNEPKAP